MHPAFIAVNDAVAVILAVSLICPNELK